MWREVTVSCYQENYVLIRSRPLLLLPQHLTTGHSNHCLVVSYKLPFCGCTGARLSENGLNHQGQLNNLDRFMFTVTKEE